MWSADLREADLSEATLRDTNLRGAMLTGTNLGKTNLLGAQLSHSTGIQVAGQPAFLPAGWVLQEGELVGPQQLTEDDETNA